MDPTDDKDIPPPLKKAKKTVHETISDIEAMAYVTVVVPPPPIPTSVRKGAKQPSEQQHQRNPFIFLLTISYDDFLAKGASASCCYVEALTGMKWKFEKPAKGDTKPLTTAISFTTMINQLKDKTNEHVIIIYMPPLIKLDAWPVVVSPSSIINSGYSSALGMGYRGR